MDGSIKIQPKYDSVSPRDDERRWFVFANKKMGVVNDIGYEVLPAMYDTIIASPVHSQYHDYYIIKNGKEGFADMWGQTILEPEYEKVVVCLDRPDTNYSFLIKEKGLWKLMDADKKLYLEKIENYTDEYEGTYLFKIKNKWGAYNVAKKKIILNNEYDTIGRLKYFKDAYTLKKKFTAYKYFAKKGNDFFILTNYFEVTPLKKPIEELFAVKYDNEDSPVFSKIEVSAEAPTFTNVESLKTIGEPLMNGSVRIETRGWDKIKEMLLTKENGKSGLTVRYSRSTQSIPAEYDSIKLINYSGKYINEQYVVVTKEKKWGVYDIENGKLAVPVEYSSIEFSRQQELLLLYKKKELSAYKLQSNYGDEPSAIIFPFVDNVVKSTYIYSYNERYSTPVTFYYYLNNGKLYPVGSNGINYYKD